MLSVSPPIWPEKRAVDTVLFDGVALRPSEPESVTFEGRQYAADAALPVLMGVFFDANRATEDRALALRTLRPVASQLHKSPWLTKLVDYTEECEDQSLRLMAMETVAASWDPHGLPLLSKLLASEDDPVLRFGMAGTLAAWNVRDGVRVLVDLVDSELMLSGNRPLWAPVLQGLEELNDIKGWGFPMAEVKQEIEQIAELQDRLTVYRQRWKEWFAENETRFPDWKPGDPLPNAASGDKDQRRENRSEDK